MTVDDIVSKVTDPYERPARLYPALLTVLPVIALVMLLYAPKTTAMTAVVTVAVSCGGLYMITNVCREFGKRVEGELYRDWGGKPTTQLLRHRDPSIESTTKRRYHAFLGNKINLPFPDKDQENADPEAADDIYQSGIRWLLNQTRQDDTKKFDLIFKENVTYGFRRNALGMKPIGVTLCVGCFLWVLFRQGVLISPNHGLIDMNALLQMPDPATTSLLVSALMLLIWIFFFTKTTMRTAAFTYAETLLRACDSL
jgi:hypothetical protein